MQHCLRCSFLDTPYVLPSTRTSIRRTHEIQDKHNVDPNKDNYFPRSLTREGLRGEEKPNQKHEPVFTQQHFWENAWSNAWVVGENAGEEWQNCCTQRGGRSHDRNANHAEVGRHQLDSEIDDGRKQRTW